MTGSGEHGMGSDGSDVGRKAADNAPEFVLCACGKERPVRIDHRLGSHMMRRLAEMSACRACEADMSREMNICPETVPVPGGVAACERGWHHEGRCEPFDTHAVILAAREATDGPA